MGAERGELVIEDLALPLALRFISGKYQGGEFPLPESGEIVIGRSSELDMVLVEVGTPYLHRTHLEAELAMLPRGVALSEQPDVERQLDDALRRHPPLERATKGDRDRDLGAQPS